jgi:hypothetical protein
MYFLPFDLTIIIGITLMDLLTKPMATLIFADKNPLVGESVNSSYELKSYMDFKLS